MSHPDRNTKEIILDTALDLFRVHGYSTVSIRDICKVVGIKESSVYYHFKNKEDILHTILQRAEQWVEAGKNSFNDALQIATKISCKEFIAVGISYIEKFLLDERIFKAIQMLTIEKQRNKTAANLYHELLFTLPLKHQSNVFAHMMERGFIREDNREALAAEYQAVILFVFQKYFSGFNTLISDAKVMAAKDLALLLRRYYNHYFYKGTELL